MPHLSEGDLESLKEQKTEGRVAKPTEAGAEVVCLVFGVGFFFFFNPPWNLSMFFLILVSKESHEIYISVDLKCYFTLDFT